MFEDIHEFKRVQKAKAGSKLREAQAEIHHLNDLYLFNEYLQKKHDIASTIMAKNKAAQAPVPQRIIAAARAPVPEPEPQPQPQPTTRSWSLFGW